MMNWIRLSLACALGAWIADAPADTPQPAATDEAASIAIQDLAFDWQMAIGRAHRLDSAVDRETLAAINDRLQTMRKHALADPVVQRKLQQLDGLVANARIYNELRARGESTYLPYAGLPIGRRVELRVEAAAGSTCALAAAIAPGDPLATTLAPAGDAGDAAWVRVAVPPGQQLALSTLGSEGDVDVAVLEDCSAADPIAYNDDYYGLQALLALPVGQPRDVLVRIGNRETGRAAAARIEVVRASGFSGKVTVAPVPVAVGGLQISHFEAGAGYYRGSGYAQQDGTYTVSTFGDGGFHARTGYFSATYNLINEAYPDVTCSRSDYISLSDCTPGALGVISVTGSQTTNGIDFMLETGRGLGFSVTSDQGGAPIYNASVVLSDATGFTIASGWTDQNGRIRFMGLRPGIAYYARVAATGYRTEAYDNVPCEAPCSLPAGTPISFAPGGPMVRELTVGLAVRPALKVYIKELPSAYEYPDARLLHPSGQTAAYGSFQTVSDVPGWRLVTFTDPIPGDYYVLGGYSASSYTRLHPGIDCLDDCVAQLANAQQINIPTNQVPSPVFLEPKPFPRVEGLVQEAGTSLPVQAEVLLVSIPGNAYGTATANGDGEYRFAHVRPGSYLVVARSSRHVDVGYPNAPCDPTPYGIPNCPNATPVQITSAAAGFRYDFTLNRSASVSGTLRLEGTQSGYAFTWSDVSLRQADGRRAGAPLTIAQNQYTLSDVEPGSYRVVIEPSAPLHGQVYPGIHCAGSCPTSQGQWVPVSTAPVTGIDFDLRLAQGVKGTVLASPGGQPLSGMVIDIWAEQPSGAGFAGSVLTGPDGRFVFPYAYSYSGFRVATSVGPDYVNEVYNNVACPLGPVYFGLCSLAEGVVIPAAHAVDSRGITLRLAPTAAGILFEDGME